MKITVIPTGNAPSHYSFNGAVITANHGNQSEDFDLSALENGGQFGGVSVDTLELPGSQVVRDAYRDAQGELHVTICQKVGPGHWETGSEFDVAQYDPAKAHVKLTDKDYSGIATVFTANGKTTAFRDNGSTLFVDASGNYQKETT